MRNTLFSITFILSLCSFAQLKQHGVVKLYNEENEKTPLGGVQVIVTGAQSQVSDANGAFTLSFNTLKAGDQVQVSASKTGYEIFNKDAMDRYSLARDKKNVLTVIMVDSKKFRALCQRYYSVSSASYAKQRQKELDQLAAQRRANKLEEKEYRRKIAEVNADYEQKKQNIAVYAEQFARIDLEHLSDMERAIIQLVKDGKLDEAIAEYEKLDAGSKYKTLSRELSKISKDLLRVDELLDCKTNYAGRLYYNLNKQIDLYIEEGGEENYEKAGELLKKAADADTTNFEVVEKYAKFAEDNGKFAEALEYYKIALPQVKDHEESYLYLQAKIDELEKKMSEGEAK